MSLKYEPSSEPLQVHEPLGRVPRGGDRAQEGHGRAETGGGGAPTLIPPLGQGTAPCVLVAAGVPRS